MRPKIAAVLRRLANRLDPPTLTFTTKLPGGFSEVNIEYLRRVDGLVRDEGIGGGGCG